MMKHSTTRNQQGYTIVEILVSIIVGAILIGSVNTVYTNQLYLSQLGRDELMVNGFAEGKIEALRSKGYLGLAAGTSDTTAELPDELNTPRSANIIISQESVSVKRVELAITYNQQGKNREYNYTTLLGELGVGQY